MAADRYSVVTPAELRERLRGGGELALLDVRGLEAHRAGHLLWASQVGLDQLDHVTALVPRRATPIVLAEVPLHAAGAVVGALHARGYEDVAVLQGGNAAWVADGGNLYAKLCVPSKALAEQARAAYATPETDVEELASWGAARSGAATVLDVRTPAEHAAGTIPGAVNVPGGELLLRAFDELAPGRPTVVTCAGRTRAIFAAQTLIDAGVPGVSYLAGGTTAWGRSGRALEVGSQRIADVPPPHGPGYARAIRAARELAGRFAIRPLGRTGLHEVLARTDRTTYLIDPRTPAPPTAHPLAHAIPGGQLVEAVDEFLAVRGAQVVLLDDDPYARAIPLARWLDQLGMFSAVHVASAHDARVLAGDPAAPPESAAAAVDTVMWSHALPQLLVDEPGVAFRHFPQIAVRAEVA